MTSALALAEAVVARGHEWTEAHVLAVGLIAAHSGGIEPHALDHDDLARLRDMERRVGQGAGLKPGEARRLLLIVSAQAHMLKHVREESKRVVRQTSEALVALRIEARGLREERDAEKRRADVATAKAEYWKAARDVMYWGSHARSSHAHLQRTGAGEIEAMECDYAYRESKERRAAAAGRLAEMGEKA